jgi:hypothetical protein
MLQEVRCLLDEENENYFLFFLFYLLVLKGIYKRTDSRLILHINL